MISLAAAGLLALTTAPAMAGETLERVMDRGEMVVATNSGWPPQSFLSEENEMVGFDIDVATEIADRLGVDVRFETPDWATMTGGRWNGRYDLGVGSVTPTKARAKVIDFPGTYYFSPYVWVVHEDSEVQNVEELNGKVIGVETATTSEDYIRRRLEIAAPDQPPIEYKVEPGDVRTYGETMLLFDDLRLGDGVRVDAVIAPVQTTKGVIESGYPLRIIEGEFAFREPLVVITEKGDEAWNNKITEVLDSMKQDGTLAEFSTKWYGENFAAE